jgi:hypothetical protein
MPLIFGSEFSFLSARVIVKLATDSICTRDLGIQVEMSFLYFQLQAVRSLLRRLALLLGHDLAVPDIVILYHTFIEPESSYLGLRLLQAFIQQDHIRIRQSILSSTKYRSCMPLCADKVPDLRMSCGSRLVNNLVVWASLGVAYGILLH